VPPLFAQLSTKFAFLALERCKFLVPLRESVRVMLAATDRVLSFPYPAVCPRHSTPTNGTANPIALPDGRKLVSLNDAANYMTKLPKKES